MVTSSAFLTHTQKSKKYMDTPNPSRQRKQVSKRTRREKRNKALRLNNKSGEIFMRGWGRQMSIPSEHQHNTRNKKSNRNRFAVKAKHKKRLKKNG